MRIKEFIREYQKIFYLALGLIVAWLGSIPLQSYLLKRTLTRTTVTILKNWETNNLTANFTYWKVPENAPPIYGLLSYKIVKSTYQMEGEIPAYKFYLELEFPADTLLPAGKTWILEYYKFPRIGWLVANFGIDNSNPPE